MMNSECTYAHNVVKGMEALLLDLKKLPPLDCSDPRLVVAFDAVLNGADSTYSASESALLEKIGVPAELYT
jgi:hypothetical protein